MRLLIIILLMVSFFCLGYCSNALSQEDSTKKEIVVTVSFAFNFIDTLPPYLDQIAPPKDAKRVPADTSIVFHIKDAGYGVNASSIRLWVAGEEIINLSSSIDGSSNDYKITYAPPTNFPWGERIVVRVFAQDIASPPNEMDTTYSFVIEPGPAVNLANASVFPNPYKPYQGQTFVTFDGLTAQARIEVFTIMGEKIYSADETDGDGKSVWNVVNDSDKKLASGVYICRITNNKGEEKFFKLAIIR